MVCRIPYEGGKLSLHRRDWRPMQDIIKQHGRDIRLRVPRTRSAVSENAHNSGHQPLWNEVKFIDRDPHCYTSWVKEVIHVRLNPNNINRDSGMESPEAWMPTIKKHNNRRAVRQRTAEGTTFQNSEEKKPTNQSQQRIMLYKVTHNQTISSPDED